MDTIHFQHEKKPLMIAHRGVSGLEQENTCAAFVAAGNRSYFGVETDVHRTKDGRFVIMHDDNTRRTSGVDHVIEETDYETLRRLPLLQKDGKSRRSDLWIPDLEDYIGICKHYEKICILELKNQFTREDVNKICDIIEKMEYLDGVIFISFAYDNLTYVKDRYPEHKVQFLTDHCDEKMARKLQEDGMDLDIYFGGLDAETAERCRKYGIEINCWTVDTPADAAKMADLGVKYITSNILE